MWSIQAGPAVSPITKGSIGTGVVEVGTLLVPYRVAPHYKVIVYWSENKVLTKTLWSVCTAELQSSQISASPG